MEPRLWEVSSLASSSQPSPLSHLPAHQWVLLKAHTPDQSEGLSLTGSTPFPMDIAQGQLQMPRPSPHLRHHPGTADQGPPASPLHREAEGGPWGQPEQTLLSATTGHQGAPAPERPTEKQGCRPPRALNGLRRCQRWVYHLSTHGSGQTPPAPFEVTVLALQVLTQLPRHS